MPKVYGLKEMDSAVAHVLSLIFSGRMRTGDRVDRNRIAAELGISRVPIQEALVQLENDGILTTAYHRGAFLERFDADVVREHYEVFGMLSGIASARAADAPTPRLLGELASLLGLMRNAGDSEAFSNHTWEFRRTINHDYAGPRLRAAIRSSQSFMPEAFWLNYQDNQARMLPFYEQEYTAIRLRDADAAQAACVERAAAMAQVLVDDLVRRGVLDPEPGYEALPPTASPAGAAAATGTT